MLKKTVTFQDFDGAVVSEDLYFNISIDEMLENIYLQDRAQEMSVWYEEAEAKGEDLTQEQKVQVLNIIKEFMKLGYGVRDGNKHRKSEEYWQDFLDSLAYDAFLMSLFTSGEAQMADFLFHLLPLNAEMQAEVRKKMNLPEIEPGAVRTIIDEHVASAKVAIENYTGNLTTNQSEEDDRTVGDPEYDAETEALRQQLLEEDGEEVQNVFDDEKDSRPDWLKEGREPTKDELRKMGKAELRLAMQFKNAQKTQG